MTLYMEYQKQRRAGVEEGIAQGRKLGIAQMAKKLLRAGLTIPAVAQMAEMPEEAIRRIAEEDGIPAS